MSDKINHALYSAILEDGTQYVGGSDYRDTKWVDIPDSKIKRIFYRLPGGDYLTLAGYEKYYHMIEGTKDCVKVSRTKNTLKPIKAQTRIEYAYIMGKIKDKVVSYRITLFNRENGRYRVGDIVKRVFDVSLPFIKGLNSDGWK